MSDPVTTAVEQRGEWIRQGSNERTPVSRRHQSLRHSWRLWHMRISNPPKHAVSQVAGYIKGRVPSMWPASGVSASAISAGSISGRAATSCRQLGETRPRSEL